MEVLVINAVIIAPIESYSPDITHPVSPATPLALETTIVVDVPLVTVKVPLSAPVPLQPDTVTVPEVIVLLVRPVYVSEGVEKVVEVAVND
jgi:hypothetical protein